MLTSDKTKARQREREVRWGRKMLSELRFLLKTKKAEDGLMRLVPKEHALLAILWAYFLAPAGVVTSIIGHWASESLPRVSGLRCNRTPGYSQRNHILRYSTWLLEQRDPGPVGKERRVHPNHPMKNKRRENRQWRAKRMHNRHGEKVVWKAGRSTITIASQAQTVTSKPPIEASEVGELYDWKLSPTIWRGLSFNDTMVHLRQDEIEDFSLSPPLVVPCGAEAMTLAIT
ncbi:hypothetical protein HAX54_044597 [Datura stramonium]|uniref:Uncharacterized protein n=1 Tax=Datura stramonium TaxID=4076 RepID=A0ABS8WEX7_DATST|nr:hypothetical protein [Datura stramonium]